MTRRDDDGAVAVLVAVMSVVLFGVAALAVDLGHAWATKRAVQRQVDVAALSTGHLLPASAADLPAIAVEVASYLNANLVGGQPPVAWTDLVDAARGNGELALLDEDGGTCTSSCVRMAVHAPAARVAFGFAGILGESGTDVQRAATVQVGSTLPSREDILPFWLPSGCGYGPALADAGTTSSTASGPTGPGEEESGGHVLSGSSLTVTSGSEVAVSDLSVSLLPANVDRASIRFTSPDGATFVDYAAQSVGRADPLPIPEFLVGTEVTAIPGTWTVRAVVQERGTGQPSTSSTAVSFTVTGESPATVATPASVAVGCVGHNRGNFGQLDSPRQGVTGRDAALSLNIALGLDHQLVPYVPPSGVEPTKECDPARGGFLPGAVLDDVSQDGRNCILADPGNNGPALLDGFVTGVDGVAGRLAQVRGATTCPDSPQLVIDGVALNNDTLACFLRNGATLDDIAQPEAVSPEMLSAEVLESPRFVWLPVVHATDRAQKRFQPIREFVPAFITSETQTSGPAETNGLEVTGGSVTSLQVFVFNEATLPVDPRSATVAYDASRPSVVRLVG